MLTGYSHSMAQQQTFQFPTLDGNDAGHGLPQSPSARHHPPTPRKLACLNPDDDVIESLLGSITKHSPGGAHISRDARRLVATILAARGMGSEADVEQILRSDLSRLPDPSTMKNFDQAIAVISDAVRKKEKIGINGDYDVDGTTAVAQAVMTLSATGVPLEWHIPHRETDGYGLSDRIVQKFIQSGCKVVLLFDHGSHNIQQVADLRAAGVEVVVFDHHTVGDTLPDAIVVNPAQPGCGFAQYRPCASGLAFFVSRRIAETFKLPAPHCGLAALGTIADMVPLDGANRIIARNGLIALQNGLSRGITHLASQLGLLPSSLSSVDVGFYVGPAINAAGRLGGSRRCVELMIGNDEASFKEIARELVDANDERKKIQRRQLTHNYDRLATLPRLPRVLVAYHPDHHQGVVGLTAQGLAQRYARPAFVFASGGDGTLKGSARVGSDLYDLASMLAEARKNDSEGIILKAGGHRAAAGVTIRAEGLNGFVKLISQAASKQSATPPEVARVVADTTLVLKQLTPRFIQGAQTLLDPFGQNFAQPRFLFESVTVLDVDTFEGGRHMLLLEQDNVKVRAFVGPEQWDGTVVAGAVIDLIATPATIYRNDKYHVQLSVDGYRVSALPEGARKSKTVGDDKPADLSSVSVPREIKELSPPPVLRPRVRPDEPSALPPRYVQLRDAFVREMNGLPRRFLDLDLKDLIQKPFDPDITPQLEASRIALIGAYELSALKPESFEVRPEQLEFIRWFLERKDNAILQAPTGSGKTEIALVIASKQRSMGHRTIFCAPTVEIQRQVKDRAPQMIDVEATLLDGQISPQKRQRIYSEIDPAFMSAIPHVIKNDIESGIFAFRPTDLLIIDEGHHTTGDYPYVPLVRKAREAGARVLLLSATPGQIEPEKSWEKFEILKELIGVERIFPLNVVRRQPNVKPRHLELPDDMKEAVQEMSHRLEWLRDSIFEYLNRHASGDLIRETRTLLGSQSLNFPSANTLLPLIGKVRMMNDDRDRWGVVNSLCAIIELSELYQCLVYQGISGFLSRVAEKRFETTYPVAGVATASGRMLLSPKRSLLLVYSSGEVRRAYDRLAQGEFVGLWDPRSLERLSGLSLTGWREKTSKERRRLYNQAVSATLKRLSNGLVELPYSDHPKERFIIEQIRQAAHKEQSIVFVRDRAHALFLSARLSHVLKDYGQTAVALTGSGSGMKRGLSREARKDNLEDLAAGRAQIIVSTSAGNEGIDFARVQKGFVYRFSASPVAALQQWGRVGRRDTQGEVAYLCTAPEEHGKFLSVLRKIGDFYRMLNHERQAIIDRYAARER